MTPVIINLPLIIIIDGYFTGQECAHNGCLLKGISDKFVSSFIIMKFVLSIFIRVLTFAVAIAISIERLL